MNIIHMAITACLGLSLLSTCAPVDHGRTGTGTHNMGTHMLKVSLDGHWQLVRASGLDVRSVHLTVNGDRYGLNAGCNSMNGQIVMSQGRQNMSFSPGSSTLMGCPDDYENRVAAAMSRIVNYQQTGDMLTLSDGHHVSLVFERRTASALAAGRWQVAAVNISNGVVSSIHQPRQYVEFDHGRLSGHDSCNTVSGRYRIEGEHISITDLLKTEMACPPVPDGYDWEAGYLSALQNAARIYPTSYGLELRDTSGALLLKLVK